MRTFRLIGMTLLMIMLTVNFTACSDDDDNELSLPPSFRLWLCYKPWLFPPINLKFEKIQIVVGGGLPLCVLSHDLLLQK